MIKDNQYQIIEDVDKHPALHVLIYENNHKVVADQIFYFENAITVNGKKDSTYMIRFYSTAPKLIIVNHDNFVQGSYFNGLVKTEKLKTVNSKISQAFNKLSQTFTTLKTTHWI